MFAASITIRSSRGHLYCDIFTDLATRRHYPVFTKDRSSHELCEKTRQLFIKHPEWTSNASRYQTRFIRLDSESNYKSIEILTKKNRNSRLLGHVNFDNQNHRFGKKGNKKGFISGFFRILDIIWGLRQSNRKITVYHSG
jgi:hypothetical protein